MVHTVVARSTFGAQNVQNTSVSDDFWKLRCRKSARRCGAKHILRSKCAKHLSVGRLLEVAMSKKCTPLWREAHLEVKMLKTLRVRTTFRGSDVVSRGRRTRLWILSFRQKLAGIGQKKSNFRQYGQMKSRARQRQREEKDQKREDQRRERVRRRKMEMREKVGISRFIVFFE